MKIFTNEKDIKASFNILPDKNVQEIFHIKKIIIEENKASAIFSRTYISEMEDSPNHITMTVLPLLTQRVFYAWACIKMGYNYTPFEKELLKIWPTRVEFKYPKIIDNEKDIVYELNVEKFRKISEFTYFVKGNSHIENQLFVNAEAIVILINKNSND